MRSSARELLFYHLPAAAWLAAATVALALPGREVAPRMAPFAAVEDAGHGLLTLILAWLGARSLGRLPATRGRPGLAYSLTALWALGMEGVQQWIPGRGWEWSDLLYSLLGVGVAAWLGRRRPRASRYTAP